MASFHDLSAETLEGETFSFSDLKGKRVLIVNTASRCGYTRQTSVLLYKQCSDKDFVILGFQIVQGFKQGQAVRSENFF